MQLHILLLELKSEKAEEKLEKNLLKRTLSDSKINFKTSTDETDFKLNRYQTSLHLPTEKKIKKGSGPRALKRRKGKKLVRKSSFNGHWYHRETAVFTPPQNSIMSIWTTSLDNTQDILKMILEKYKVENKLENYGIFLVYDSGERRLVNAKEFPLR